MTMTRPDSALVYDLEQQLLESLHTKVLGPLQVLTEFTSLEFTLFQSDNCTWARNSDQYSRAQRRLARVSLLGQVKLEKNGDVVPLRMRC